MLFLITFELGFHLSVRADSICRERFNGECIAHPVAAIIHKLLCLVVAATDKKVRKGGLGKSSGQAATSGRAYVNK
jgi:hypothetical protein